MQRMKTPSAVETMVAQLRSPGPQPDEGPGGHAVTPPAAGEGVVRCGQVVAPHPLAGQQAAPGRRTLRGIVEFPRRQVLAAHDQQHRPGEAGKAVGHAVRRSEEHTSELQSLMRISYAVFCLKKKKHK